MLMAEVKKIDIFDVIKWFAKGWKQVQQIIILFVEKNVELLDYRVQANCWRQIKNHEERENLETSKRF